MIHQIYMIKRCQLQLWTVYCRFPAPEISDRSLSSRQPSRRSELFKSPITFLVQFSQAVTVPGLQNYPFVWVQLTYRQWVLSLWIGYALSLQLVILELKSSKPEAFGLEKKDSKIMSANLQVINCFYFSQTLCTSIFCQYRMIQKESFITD